jgi:hypothetical protein
MKKNIQILVLTMLVFNSYAKTYGEHLVQLLSPQTLANVWVEIQAKELSLSTQQQSQLIPVFTQMINKIRKEEVPYASILIQQHTAIDSVKELKLPKEQQQWQLKAIRESYKSQLQDFYLKVIVFQNEVVTQLKTILTPAQLEIWQSTHQEKVWYQSLIQG